MATKVKQRIHREWFRTVSLGNRKSCPHCHTKLLPGESIWSWGEYIRVKWHTVMYFCKQCFPEVQKMLQTHADPCGCTFELIGKGETLPEWLKLNN